MIANEPFVRRDHVLDHLVKPGQLLPCIAIGVQTRDVARLFALEEELIEEDDCIGLAAAQQAEQGLLRTGDPLQSRGEKLRYLHRNPVKRGLVRSPEDWGVEQFSSLSFRR